MHVCLPATHAIVLRTVPSLQASEEQLIRAATYGRTEKVIALLDIGVHIDAADTVRHGDPGMVGCYV